jgi:rhodanese-related sulfurtransferase
LLQVLLRRNRAVEGRLIELFELARRHIVDFVAAQRAHELLPLVEPERLQVVTRTIANASQHLQQLRRAGLAEARRDGKRVLYRLADGDVVGLLGALRRVTERNVGAVEKVLNSYFRERDNLEAVSRKELLRRMREGLVTVIDTRPAEEFAAGHLPGALNVPLRELKRRLRELPREQTIVAYCRGAYCVLSYEAVAELRKRGFKAFRLEEGYPEWRAAGLPVEQSATA